MNAETLERSAEAELFDGVIIRTLEGATGNKLKVSELRRKAQMTRGILSVLQDMAMRKLVSLSPGELGMETEVSLAHG